MAIQARFFVRSATQHSHNPDAREIVMGACTRGEEAKEWSKWTPSGELKMFVTNPAAIEKFTVGKEYLSTFEPVEAPLAPAQGV